MILTRSTKFELQHSNGEIYLKFRHSEDWKVCKFDTQNMKNIFSFDNLTLKLWKLFKGSRVKWCKIVAISIDKTIWHRKSNFDEFCWFPMLNLYRHFQIYDGENFPIRLRKFWHSNDEKDFQIFTFSILKCWKLYAVSTLEWWKILLILTLEWWKKLQYRKFRNSNNKKIWILKLFAVSTIW